MTARSCGASAVTVTTKGGPRRHGLERGWKGAGKGLEGGIVGWRSWRGLEGEVMAPAAHRPRVDSLAALPAHVARRELAVLLAVLVRVHGRRREHTRHAGLAALEAAVLQPTAAGATAGGEGEADRHGPQCCATAHAARRSGPPLVARRLPLPMPLPALLAARTRTCQPGSRPRRGRERRSPSSRRTSAAAGWPRHARRGAGRRRACR